MFTVKWVVRHADGEVIRMFEAENVTVAYRNQDPNAVAKESWEVEGRVVERSLLIVGHADLSSRSLDVGVAYVMNEAGATVGKYVLNDDIIRAGRDAVVGMTAPTPPMPPIG